MPRGHFIGVANGFYPDYPPGLGRYLPAVRPDMDLVAERFKAAGFLTELHKDLSSDEIFALLESRVRKGDFAAEDRVVFWFSGHGVHDAAGLGLAGVDHASGLVISAGCVPSAHLYRALEGHAALHRMLVVLDCCFAGAAAGDLQLARMRQDPWGPAEGRNTAQIALLAAGRGYQSVRDGVFVTRLLSAWDALERDPRYASFAYLPLGEIAAGIETGLGEEDGWVDRHDNSHGVD
ncbi:caspase family protein [Streptomyces sp. NPDC053431]|uniref:caspase family protein n=1 Tax=Streptomyces sp. NPDC053431 TaxID=3365703 RepID=UPI0037D56681